MWCMWWPTLWGGKRAAGWGGVSVGGGWAGQSCGCAVLLRRPLLERAGAAAKGSSQSSGLGARHARVALCVVVACISCGWRRRHRRHVVRARHRTRCTGRLNAARTYTSMHISDHDCRKGDSAQVVRIQRCQKGHKDEYDNKNMVPKRKNDQSASTCRYNLRQRTHASGSSGELFVQGRWLGAARPAAPPAPGARGSGSRLA